MRDSFLLKVDKDQEILKTRELLKVDYDPDRIVQHYYKKISEARLLLTALRETVTDAEVMRNSFVTVEQHIGHPNVGLRTHAGQFPTKSRQGPRNFEN